MHNRMPLGQQNVASSGGNGMSGCSGSLGTESKRCGSISKSSGARLSLMDSKVGAV